MFLSRLKSGGNLSSQFFNSAELREIVASSINDIVDQVNQMLSGKDVAGLRSHWTTTRGAAPPYHWLNQLEHEGTLPNKDGKTLGSVVEILLVYVLESGCLRGKVPSPLRISPARGIDLPDLGLGLKSPSKNYCTSEPFYSYYERLCGNEHDLLVFITDYQDSKKNPEMRLKIESARYLRGSQVADKGLCEIVRANREFLLNLDRPTATRYFQFIAHVNQRDWLASRLLQIAAAIREPKLIEERVNVAIKQYHRALKTKNPKSPPPGESALSALREILEVRPVHIGLINALTNWVIDHAGDVRQLTAREFSQIADGPLDGLISMSPALQWRYNFEQAFKGR